MRRKKTGAVVGMTVFCVLMVLLAAVWRTSRIGAAEGEKTITVEVIHSDASVADYTYQTDVEFLGELLTEEGLISGSQSAYGLFVDTVDGETADYNRDGGWWQLRRNGEEAQTGADSVPLQDGDRFTWTYTRG